MKNPKYSIIIVHYKNELDLIETLNSLYKFNPNNLFEVIIVDNSENFDIKNKIKNYKNLIYCNSGKNLGYGKGINYGAKRARGEYLFVLNPDVVFNQNILTTITNEFKKRVNVGIIAPLLLNSDLSVMKQGPRSLSFLAAIVKLSFIDKIFPNNFVSKRYWTTNWMKNKVTKVENVPGTAFVIKKDLFNKIKGFDEKFFLYFEEFDLCDRVRDLGYEIFIDSRLKLIHKWGTSTSLLSNKDEIFINSRNYYLRKKFGVLKALVINIFLSLTLSNLVFLLLLGFAALVRIYNFQSVLDLGIGDQGWFYLSARNLINFSIIPLVGITSSHVWLHQGALWTYILAIIFKIFTFNPLAPVLFTIILDLMTLTLLFKITTKMFNKASGLLAVSFYAFSVYVVMASRMPYHTSLIPSLTLIYIYSVFKWVKGEVKYFPVVLLFLSLLYNFELQTVIFIFTTTLIFIFGLLKRKSWVLNLKNKKIIYVSLILFFLPLIPIILYDVSNGFPQTFVFGGWILYKVYSIFTVSHSSFPIQPLVNYFVDFMAKLFLVRFAFVSAILFILGVFYSAYKGIWKKNINFAILFIVMIFLILGIFINKTLSDAYLYSLIIPLVILVSAFLGNLFKNIRLNLILLIGLNLILVSNIYFLKTSNYYEAYKDNHKYFSKNEAALYLAKQSQKEEIRILGKGDGSQFASFLDYYKYLIWYYGGNVSENSKSIYILNETPCGTRIIKGDNNAKYSNTH